MGLETLSGFRESVNHALGEKRQGNERLDRWINDAHVELFAELEIHGQRSCGTAPTVVGERELNLPTDFVALLVLKNLTSKKRVIKTSLENFQLLSATAEGSPSRYTRVGDLLSVHPLPKVIETIQMFYVKEPTPLSAGSDVTELPAMYDRVIHLIGLRNALIDLQVDERATFIYQIAQNKLGKLPTEDWLEAQTPQEGIQIARSFRDLQRDAREGLDENFSGRVLL